MDHDQYRNKHRKTQIRMRRVKDFTMAALILAIGLLMFLGDKISVLQPLMQDKDPLLKNIFGSLCLLYGGFRLWRAATLKDY